MLKKLGGYRRNAWVDIAGICTFLEMIGPKHHDTVDFHHIDSEPSMTQQKLDKSDSIERERDTAVEKYNDAKRAGDYDEMLKWETIANDRQQDLYYL